MTQGIQGVLGLALGALLPASALAQELAFEAEAGRLAVSPSGIAGIERTQDEVLILLQPEVARAFADLTGQAVGQPMAVTLCGRTLTQPVVRDRIDSGRIAIALGSGDRAVAVTNILNGMADCASLNDL